MSTTSSDATSTTTTKRIVMASALLLGGQGCVGAASANPAFVSRSNHHHHHRTLWGISRPLSSSSDHTVALDSLLSKIPRGGADEATPDEPKGNKKKSKEPKKKKNRKDKEKDNNNKKQNKRDKKKKESKAETGGATSKDNEEEPPQSPPSNPMVDEILKSEDYYDILGLSRGEDNAGRIKKAYRRRAVQTHPDKTGGDRRAFDKLAEAYDVLLDDEKRALYDRHGKAGLDPTAQHRHGGSGGPEDLFRSFFGAGPQQQQQPQGPINRTLRYQYTVTLEELYQGVSHKVTVEAPPERFGFGNYQQQQAAPARKKQVEVTVPRGAHAGQNIRLSGEMDFYSQEAPPGDLVFSLQLRPHKIFTRKGHDLAMTATISLAEAIGGCTRVIRHLDGRIITIESAKLKRPVTDDDDNVVDNNDDNSHEGPTLDDLENNNHGKTSSSESVNVYIQTGDVQVLKGQGMPKDPQGTEFGDLYVQYEVEVPKGQASLENLTPSERLELARLLEKLEGKTATASSNNSKPSRKGKRKEAFYTMAPAKLSDFGHASGVPNLDDDEEEDDHHHQQQQFPFHGMGHRQFFYSSTGRSPFFGQETNFEDDENVQCRQM